MNRMPHGPLNMWKAIAPTITQVSSTFLQRSTRGFIPDRVPGLYTCCDEQYRKCGSWRSGSPEPHRSLQTRAHFSVSIITLYSKTKSMLGWMTQDPARSTAPSISAHGTKFILHFSAEKWTPYILRVTEWEVMLHRWPQLRAHFHSKQH